jgi:hypothetical protein
VLIFAPASRFAEVKSNDTFRVPRPRAR